MAEPLAEEANDRDPHPHRGVEPCPAQELADRAEAPLMPWRAGQLAKAIDVLQTRETGRLETFKGV
jgi:hypothetical protein